MPGGSGGGMPGNEDWIGLAFGRFFSGPRSSHSRKCSAKKELQVYLRHGPLLRAPACVQHHAEDAVDAEPGVPEAGVVFVGSHYMPDPKPPAARTVAASPKCRFGCRIANWVRAARRGRPTQILTSCSARVPKAS